MKKINLFITIAFLAFSGISFGQSQKNTEVLFFKPNLSCCKARACDKLAGNIKKIVETNFPAKEIVFHTILIAKQENKGLVDKYNVKSQKVVVVKNRMLGKDKVVDISDIVAKYPRAKNKEEAEKEIVDKIKSVL